MNLPSTRLIVGPFNRVEGDLEVQLEIADGRVASARVVAPMYRGFEQILLGKAPHDALVIAPRICGICSVSQSVAAARALADATGIAPPPNGVIATNLMLACENLADHLSHFYLFFMPDFTRPAYAGRPWFAEVLRRFEAGAGVHARAAVAARQRWFTLIGTLGGKWPHTHSIQPGGSSRAVESSEGLRLLGKVREFRAFLEATLFGARLEEVAEIADEAELARWCAREPRCGDLRLFLEIARDAGLDTLGLGPGRYLSYGAFASPEGRPFLAAGVWDADSGSLLPVNSDSITEDVSHSRLAGDAPRHPRAGLTEPQVDKPGAYSWNKAPRLDGRVIETGAVARQVVDGHPLLRDALGRCGGTVYTRVLARLVEVARVVPQMERWLGALRRGEPYCASASPPADADAEGMGLTEAARGALGHWLVLRQGRIVNYQIVTPTSWNFSPRDAAGTPGALEAALAGTPVQPGETTPVAVQHVVRSFDPCMVCTAH